ENRIEETRYRVMPDTPGHARLEVMRVMRHEPGAISRLVPGDEVHRMHNPTSHDTVEIHVYGKDLVGLERKTWSEDGAEKRLVKSQYLNREAGADGAVSGLCDRSRLDVAGRAGAPTRQGWSVAMEELTPQAVGVAARLGTAGEKGFGPHRAVVAAVAVGQVRVAPADVEYFKRRVSIGLTAGTKRTT